MTMNHMSEEPVRKRPLVDDDPPVKKTPVIDDAPVLETVDERQGMFECATDGEVDEATASKAQRLEFDVDHMPLRDMRDPLVERMVGQNAPPTLFARGHTLTEIVDDGTGPYLSEFGPKRMLNKLTDLADFTNGKGKTVMPPLGVIKAILGDHDSVRRFPELNRIVEVPVFGPNGELQTEPGYHAASRTFYQRPNGFVLPPVSEHPTRDEILRARSLIIDEMFGDFPFINAPDRFPWTYPVGKSPVSAERAHAVALTLLPFVRAMIDGPTPLHLVEAPIAGTGKSLLVEIALYPALGRTVKRTPEVPDEAAWRKKLASLLLEAPTVIFIDNIHDKLDSAALSSFLEGTVATDRIRGVSKMGTFENHAVWACTGNNPTAHEEILRRAIRIRLNAELERPDERTEFRHKFLRSWVHEHRAELVWACLTLIRAWLSAGRPSGGEQTDEHGFRFITPPALLASFESWSRTMSGILEVAIVPGFLENRGEWTPDRADPETDALQGFVESWWRYFQEEPVRASQLFQLADQHLDLEGATEHARKVALGKRLIELKDRRVGTCFIRKAEDDAHGKVNRWRLKQTMPGPRRT